MKDGSTISGKDVNEDNYNNLVSLSFICDNCGKAKKYTKARLDKMLSDYKQWYGEERGVKELIDFVQSEYKYCVPCSNDD